MVEYCVDRNGQRAAIAAGYSKKVAGVTASKLLTKPKIIAAILKVNTKDDRRLELTRERVLAELAKGLFRDLRGLVDEDGWFHGDLRKIPKELLDVVNGFDVEQTFGEDEEGSRIVIGQKFKIRIIPKEKSQDMAMKHLGAYAAEKQEAKLSLDWDAMYRRSTIIDPAADAIKQIEKG